MNTVMNKTYSSESVSAIERKRLRTLAKKVAAYAKEPIMEERRQLWRNHNDLKSTKPVIMMEMQSFKEEMLKDVECVSLAALEIERNLLNTITNYELIGDDKVVSGNYVVNWDIDIKEFGHEAEVDYATDVEGRQLGFAQHHIISDLKNDFELLKPSEFFVDREKTKARIDLATDIIGDILEITLGNDSLNWHTAPSKKVVEIMGLEKMMYAILDYPEEMHKLYAFIVEDMKAYIRWQEKEDLLVANSDNDYAGSGSYGFTHDLQSAKALMGQKILSQDLWGNLNSQETVGISPTMYEEFIHPYYMDLAKEFGLIYYGCCEPVHDIWTSCVSHIPGLRKVSISPWCDQKIMGDYLRGSKVIFCRKPSPNFVGVGEFREEDFRAHIIETLEAARGCHLEFSFRDIYTLDGDKNKAGRAVAITRELIEKHWQG